VVLVVVLDGVNLEEFRLSECGIILVQN